MSIQDVAELTGLGWDTVKEIHKAHLRRKYKSFNLKKIRYIAIDEVYLGKKRKFITVVLNLETGRVIYIGKGQPDGKSCTERKSMVIAEGSGESQGT